MGPQLRPFTEVDWYGYAGAERFADGSEPLISQEGLSVVGWPEQLDDDFDGAVAVVLDQTGLHLTGRDGFLHLEVDRAVGQEIADLLFRGDRVQYRALVALGFVPGNMPEKKETR